METPYRNDRLMRAIESVCADDTLLCVATELTLPTEQVGTRTVERWRAARARIGKRATVFLLLAAARRRSREALQDFRLTESQACSGVRRCDTPSLCCSLP